MRTYILAMWDMRTKRYTRFQCQANSFNEAVEKAQKSLNGGFPGFAMGTANGGRHASFNG
jgi:hypothetical protein